MDSLLVPRGATRSFPLRLLKRHPFGVTAFLQRSLVLTYAYPREILAPLLPPGLVLDTFDGYGFLAIALVETRRLRPTFLPSALGRDFFLSGYRLFVRCGSDASSIRGLFILRSDTDRRSMVGIGNLFTHYRYSLCHAQVNEQDGETEWLVETPDHCADLHVVAGSDDAPAPLPGGSPFSNLRQARRFAGPLPFTFDYEAETHSIIRIEGVRRQWDPQTARVNILKNTFIESEPFCRVKPALANAFSTSNVPYRWNRGVRFRLGAA